MPQTCTVCAHPAREVIDQGLVGGVPYRDQAKTHGVSLSALTRHRRSHLSPALKAVAVEREQRGVRSAFQMLDELYVEAREVLVAAKASSAAGLTLTAIARAESLVEKMARISGELNERPQVAVINLQSSAEWISLRTAILAALRQHPAALADVQRALAASGPPGYEPPAVCA